MNTFVASHRGRVVACAVLLSLCAAFTAVHRTFVSLANYDDQGYLIWTVKNFFAGQPLYDQVHTVYGPLYYLYEWCVLSITGLPAGDDPLRLVSAAFWVAAALLAFLLVYRATGSIVLAMCAHLLILRALAFIGEEPAHPQEVCIFLLLALGRAFYVANRTLRMLMMGSLGGAMAASKINLGVFIVVTLTVGLTYAQPRGRLRNVACVAVTLGALTLTPLLIWDRLQDPWALSYCVLMELSLVSTLLTVWGMSWNSGPGLRDALVVAAAFVAAAAAICCFPLLHGSTLRAMFDWLIVVPRRSYSQAWALPANIHPAALVWAAAGFLFAWWVEQRRVTGFWLANVKLAFGAAVLLMCATGRYGGLLNFATPFLWLVAARPFEGGAGATYILARAPLALLGVMQVLYAYPVAGSQVQFIAVFMIVVAGICFWDGLSWHQLARSEGRVNAPLVWLPAAVRATGAFLVAALSLAYAWDARHDYQSFSPLNFPGAMHVRVEPEKAAALRAIIGRINSSCGALLTEPGLFSFHLWTGKPSPVGVDHQVWMSLLDDAAQNAVVREIASDPRACVVYRRDVSDLWTKGTDVSAKPAVRFIHENLQTVFESSGYSLMMRPPANASLAVESADELALGK